MMATLLFHECPLIVIVTLGRLPPPSASTIPGGTSSPLIGSGGSTQARRLILSSRHLASARRKPCRLPLPESANSERLPSTRVAFRPD